jgi:NAD(P)-dependent dehydrogenase (short-subunit alcohol dehydrogenase family)
MPDGKSAAEAVVARIVAEGGEAISNTDSVADFAAMQAMAASALSKWGRIDVLVNNAGLLRDKSFANMDMDDFRTVVDVHLLGSTYCTKAVWAAMREQRYGRIAMTTSASGLYGSFGQANYSAAKMGLVGLMNTLHLEGAKYDIRVNCLAPIASTGMTEEILAQDLHSVMTTESVSAALLYLVSGDSPTRTILCAGGGSYSAARIYETEGIFLPPEDQTPENVAARFEDILAEAGQKSLFDGGEQARKFAEKFIAARRTAG